MRCSRNRCTSLRESHLGKAAILQGWDCRAYTINGAGWAVRNEHAGLISSLCQYEAPGIDDQGATVARPVGAVMATLGRGYDIGLALDGPSAEEDLPMVLACLASECARYDEPAGTLECEGSVEFGET